MWSLPQIQQELKEILQYDIEDTIKQFNVYLSAESSISNHVLLLNGNFKDLDRDFNILNIIDHKDFNTEKEFIRNALLLLIERLKERDLKTISDNVPTHIIPLQSQIEKIAQQQEPHYKDYLFDENLSYISRDDFVNHQNDLSDFITESYILEQLFHESNFYKGVVIYGKGGIGKTRLMYELGRRSLHQGWKVWIIQKEIKDFSAVGQFLDPEEKHVLLFDYVEENFSFKANLHQEFQNIPAAQLKIVVNCRNTFKSSSKFPNEAFFLPINLDIDAHPQQKNYQQYVVEQILQQVEHLNIKRYTKQKIKPVLAVFLKYLDGNQMIKQSDIQNLNAYKSWIQRRLAISFQLPHFSDVPREVSYLMMSLPLQGVARDHLEADHEQHIEILEQDGWLEINAEGKLVTFHDTMVDELVLAHTKNRIWLKNSLRFAIQYKALDNWLRALDRIKDQLYQTNHISKIHQLIEQEIVAFSTIPYSLAISPLFDETKRMQLFSRHLSLFESFIKTKDFIKPLAFSLNELSKGKRPPEQQQSIKKILETWLSFHPNFVKNQAIPAKHTSKILSTSIKAFGTDFNKKYFKDYLAIPFFPDQACFVLVAWLKQKGDKKITRSYLKRFLKQKSTEENTQFVLKEWLHAGGELKVIEQALKQFLTIHAQSEGSRLVLQAWIERDGDLHLIRWSLEQYLRRFSTQLDSRHLIEKWLNKSTDVAFLEPYIDLWLTAFATTLKEAQYVFRAWLQHQQNPSFIQASLKQHLTEQAAHADSRFVLQDWIKQGGDLLFIQSFLKTHLEQHGTKFHARHLLQAWLQKGGDPIWLQQYVLLYLQHYPTGENARFVLNAWLKNSLDPVTVQDIFLDYLEQTHLQENTYFLMYYWSEASGDLELIRVHAETWLQLFATSKYAKSLRRIFDA